MGKKKDNSISRQTHSLASCTPFVTLYSLARSTFSETIGSETSILRGSFVSTQTMGIKVWTNRMATVLFFVPPPIVKRTLSTYTKSLMFTNKPYVILSKCVSFIAVGFTGIIRTWAKSTQVIFPARHCFQMDGVATSRNTTQMVNVQGMFNVLNEQTVQHSMSNVVQIIDTKLPVIARIAFAPYPTRGMVAHIFNGDTRKNFSQQRSGNLNFAIIAKGHSVYSYLVNNLARVVEGLTSPSRPVLV